MLSVSQGGKKMSATAFDRLSTAFGFERSELFPRILAYLMSAAEAETMLALPGTSRSLAQKLARPVYEVSAELHHLYQRGLVFISEHTADGPHYKLIDAGRFMDSVLFDPRADQHGEHYFDLWKEFAHAELWPATGNESWNFRVLPLGEAVQPDSRIMPYEEAAQIVAGAYRIAVQQCPCRKRERNCDNPIETCLSLNELADYVLYRKAGREINTEEALSILKRCAELGLVHQTVNTDQVDVICNCCSCCCGILTPLLTYGMDKVTAKSRFRAAVDLELCIDCLECVEHCIFGALRETDGRLQALPDRCFGCGMCVTHCPARAITLVEVREPDHIPTGAPGFNLSRVPLETRGPRS
jgi:Pyruvate/2-oxoacid:ferredoxin oxidoreductase delta subunit